MPRAASPAAPQASPAPPPSWMTPPQSAAPQTSGGQRPGPYPGTQIDSSGFVSFVGGTAADPSLLPLVKEHNMGLQQRTGRNPYVSTPQEVDNAWLYPKGYNLQSAIDELGLGRFGAGTWGSIMEQQRMGMNPRQFAATRAAARTLLRRLRQQGRI